MTDATPSIEQFVSALLRDTWALFQKHAFAFVLATAGAAVLSAFTLGVLAGPLFVGVIDMVRKARRGEDVDAGQLFDRFDSFGSSCVAIVIIGVAVAVGSMLLVLPGLVVALFSGFTLHVIAYERLSAIPAIKRSLQIVRAHFLQTLVLFVLASIALTIGGSVVLGLLLTMPLSAILLTLSFEQMAEPVASEGLGPSVSRV
jgi:uncharacterized membrane protein